MSARPAVFATDADTRTRKSCSVLASLPRVNQSLRPLGGLLHTCSAGEGESGSSDARAVPSTRLPRAPVATARERRTKTNGQCFRTLLGSPSVVGRDVAHVNCSHASEAPAPSLSRQRRGCGWTWAVILGDGYGTPSSERELHVQVCKRTNAGSIQRRTWFQKLQGTEQNRKEAKWLVRPRNS